MITQEELRADLREQIEKKNEQLEKVVELLRRYVCASVEGSLSNKMDYWEEYCKAHKIEI